MERKTKNRNVLLISMFVLLCSSFMLTACGDPDPTPEPAPSKATLSLSPKDFEFSEQKNDAKTLKVETNGKWRLYVETSKISASSTEGSGTYEVTLTTTEDNEEEWSTYITVEAWIDGSAEKTTDRVQVRQRGRVASNCYARIDSIGDKPNSVVFCYGLACVMKWGNNTSSFYYKVCNDDEYNRLGGDNEKIGEEAQKSWERLQIPSSGGIEIVYDQCLPNTRYQLVTVAYDRNGKRGSVTAVPFTTKSTTDEAVAEIKPDGQLTTGDIQGGGSGTFYKWNVTQNQYCAGYYTYVCASETQTALMKKSGDFGQMNPQDGIPVAWEINSLLRMGFLESANVDFDKNPNSRERLFKKASKDGQGTFDYKQTDKYVQFLTWAVGDKDETSGIVYSIVYEVKDGHLEPRPQVPDGEYYLSASPTELTLSALPGKGTISVSTNDEYTVSSNQSWCTVNNLEQDRIIQVSVTQNESSTASRTARIEIKGVKSNMVATVNVTQSPKIETVIGYDGYDADKNIDGQGQTTYTLSATPASLSFSPAGEQKTVTVTSNDSWQLKSSQSWCTLSKSSGSGNGTFVITAAKNTGSSSRSATVTVVGLESPDVTISITQEAYSLSASPTSVNAASARGNVTITVTGSDSWTASSSATWCTLTSRDEKDNDIPPSGTGNGLIIAQIDTNTNSSDRTATITIKGTNSGKTVSVAVKQNAGTVVGRDEYGNDIDLNSK